MFATFPACSRKLSLDDFFSSGQAVTPIAEDMLNPTYANERPPCTQLYSQYNVSFFSTYARQLTTQNRLFFWTWLSGFVSMCQDQSEDLIRPHAQHARANQLAQIPCIASLYRRSLQPYLSISMRLCDLCLLPRRPDRYCEGPTSWYSID